jgi:adenylate kinase family enzyme
MFNNWKRKYIELVERFTELKDDYNKLLIRINNRDNEYSIDFDFSICHSVLSIEYHKDYNKCIICYIISIYNEEAKKVIEQYKEWNTYCSVDQYKELYDKYLVYKGRSNE